MPCNLAVTITKAAVTEEHLLSLLSPQAVADLLTRYLQAKDKSARVNVYGEYVNATIGFRSIQVHRGQVTVRGQSRYDTKDAEALAEEVRQLLAGLANALFAKQVEATLRQSGARQIIAQQHVVTNGGVKQIATVINFDL